MKILLSLTVLLILTGCASVPDVTIDSKEGSVIVPPGSNICIVFPENGSFQGKEHDKSGDKVGEIILKSIPKEFKVNTVVSAQGCSENYLVTSEILEYENRASGWSGLPDKIRVKVNLRNTKNSNFSTFTYYADSNMAASAFFEWGNAAPYTLLDGEFKNQVSALLYGK